MLGNLTSGEWPNRLLSRVGGAEVVVAEVWVSPEPQLRPLRVTRDRPRVIGRQRRNGSPVSDLGEACSVGDEGFEPLDPS